MKGKTIKILSLIFTIFVMTFSISSSVTAALPHSQDLVIVKYGLTDGATGFKSSQTTNDGLFINNLPVDNLGNSLSPMSGIHYLVQEVLPTGQANISLDNPASYQKVGASQDIVTGSNGQAELQLVDGYYIISEQANVAENLSKPAIPLLIKLPLEGNTGGYLEQVYIYPKSSVDPEATNPSTPTPPSSNPPTPSSSADGISSEKDSPPAIIGLLPDTGEARSTLAVVGLGLALVLFFIWVISRRKQEEEDEETAS